jgi:hypothetical protein
MAVPLGFINGSATPLWVAVIADYCFITFVTLYLWGILFRAYSSLALRDAAH